MDNNSKVLWSKQINKGVCPVCSSEMRISHEVFARAIEEKKIKKEDTFLTVSGKMSGPAIGLTADILVVYDDVCAECGCHYTLKIEMTQSLVTAQMPGQGQGPQMFGR